MFRRERRERRRAKGRARRARERRQEAYQAYLQVDFVILIVDEFELELPASEIYERTHLHVKYEGSLSLSSDQSICWGKKPKNVKLVDV